MFGFEFSFNTTLFDFGTYHAKDIMLKNHHYIILLFLFLKTLFQKTILKIKNKETNLLS